MKQTMLIAIAFLFVGVGCSTFTVPQYPVSVENVLRLKKSKAKSYSVQLKGPSIKEGTLPSNKRECRALSVNVSGHPSFEAYIVDGLKKELILAEKYDENSPNKIVMTFNKLDLDSHKAMWHVNGQVNYGGKSTNMKVTRDFEGSFIADNACRDLANNFVSTSQFYNSKVVDTITGSRLK